MSSVCRCQYKETQGLLYIGILYQFYRSRVAVLASPFVSFTTFIPLALLRSGFSRRRSLRVTRGARSAPLALLRSGLRRVFRRVVAMVVCEGGAGGRCAGLPAQRIAERNHRQDSQYKTRVIIILHRAIYIQPCRRFFARLQMKHHPITLRRENVIKIIHAKCDGRDHTKESTARSATAAPQEILPAAHQQYHRQDET